MILSKLEILGFKSFARRTKLEFHPGITGIVGPNGCGKSNIVDAVRWVMGEQKGSFLRSEKMEQVIFNGTQSRKPLGMAEVNITVENNDGVLPLQYSELTVSRRLYRNGDSEYLINKKKRRLKDVVDLFLDTGLGTDSYGIIEPALIGRILTDNPYERRTLFEEAAGIAKYKLRVKTAERRLQGVNDNLNRITDILSEIEKNVKKLKRQYNQAKKYEALRQRSEEVATLLMAIEYRGLAAELHEVRLKIGSLQNLREQQNRLKSEVEEKIHQLSVIIGQDDENLKQTRSYWENFSSETMKSENRLLLIDEKERSAVSEMERLKESVERSTQQIIYFRERLTVHENNLTQRQAETEEVGLQTGKIQGEFTSAESHVEKYRAEVSEIDKKVESLKGKLQSAQSEIAAKQYKIAANEERISDLNSEQRRLTENLTEIDNSSGRAEREKENLNKKMRNVSAETEVISKKIQNFKDKLATIENQRSELKVSIERYKSELQFIQSLIDSGGGIPEGVLFLLEKKPEGVIETIGNLIGVEQKFETAVETALGKAAQAVAVENTSAALDALSILREQGKGQAALIPLDAPMQINLQNETDLPGALGTANRFIECEEKYRELFHALLGNVLVVSGWEEAMKIRKSGKWDGLIVTLQGESAGKYIFSGGKTQARFPAVGRKMRAQEISATLAKTTDEADRLNRDIDEITVNLRLEEEMFYARQRELKELSDKTAKVEHRILSFTAENSALKNRISAIDSEIERLASEKDAAEENIAIQRNHVEGIQRNFTENQSILQEKRDRLQDVRVNSAAIREELHRSQLTLNNKKVEVDKVESEIKLSQARIQEIADDIERRNFRLEELKDHLDKLAEERFEAREKMGANSSLRDKWKVKLSEIDIRLNELKSARSALEKELREKSSIFEESNSELANMEIQAAELKSKISAQEDRASEKYGIDLEAVETPDDIDIEKYRQEDVKLRRRLESIGPVNLLALEEYSSQRDRLDYMHKEHDDIISSKEELTETISRTNAEARTRFRQVFGKVAEYFKLLFADLFEGGAGEIKLGSGDILEAEIELLANPGGKKLVHLDQLSGGEKTLTALALIFALYQVKPSPFCVLDEVDAPLDDANVERFIKLIRRFTPQTQFILITHNKITMEACDYLFGVTMEEEGLSKLVSVDLNTTHQMAEAP